MRAFFVVLLALAPLAHAAPWLCTEPGGAEQFSYDPRSAARKECVDRPIPSGNVWRAQPRGVDEPEAVLHVDPKTQKDRDIARRQILERELAEERRALTAAMAQLEAQKERRVSENDRARVDAGLKLYEERVRTHLTNIANLEKELAREG